MQLFGGLITANRKTFIVILILFGSVTFTTHKIVVVWKRFHRNRKLEARSAEWMEPLQAETGTGEKNNSKKKQMLGQITFKMRTRNFSL